MPNFSLIATIFVIFVTGLVINNSAHAKNELDLAPIIAQVESFLQQQTVDYAGTAQIMIDASRLEKMPACDGFTVSLPGSQRLRSRMSINVQCHSPGNWLGKVQAKIAISGYFYVAARTLNPGDVIDLDDLITREGDLLSMPKNIVIDPSLILDHIVTQRIASGSPIKANTVRNPMSVMRGQVVKIQITGTGFTIISDGQTMEEGKPGQQIRVKTSSGQIISAIVVDANTVMVPM